METLETLRKRSGLTQMKVAVSLDVAESTIRNWESGRTVPKLTPGQLKKLLTAFNCTFDDFYNACEATKQEVLDA